MTPLLSSASTYTSVRFLLGALFVLPLALREYGRLQARGLQLDRADWLAWLVDRQPPHVSVWPASIGSFIGTFMLSGGRFDTLTIGDYWVIASTFFWAAHVLWVGRVASRKGVPLTWSR